ncbi:DUF202 domain-containing protein [Amnibacterium endophyticum]|uniref:DUF202 domain-containing protein n=1 Tax=Amnibacterium endophyticum TaxID=2109337 RepID=A0ABW4LDQ6_9MICO
MTAPVDPGLQPERTALSWRRTLLALAVGALVSVRVLPDVLGPWTIGTGLAGVAVAIGLWLAAARRARAASAAFGSGGVMPGGLLLAATAVLTAAGAALGLLYLAASPR